MAMLSVVTGLTAVAVISICAIWVSLRSNGNVDSLGNQKSGDIEDIIEIDITENTFVDSTTVPYDDKGSSVTQKFDDNETSPVRQIPAIKCECIPYDQCQISWKIATESLSQKCNEGSVCCNAEEKKLCSSEHSSNGRPDNSSIKAKVQPIKSPWVFYILQKGNDDKLHKLAKGILIHRRAVYAKWNSSLDTMVSDFVISKKSGIEGMNEKKDVNEVIAIEIIRKKNDSSLEEFAIFVLSEAMKVRGNGKETNCFPSRHLSGIKNMCFAINFDENSSDLSNMSQQIKPQKSNRLYVTNQECASSFRWCTPCYIAESSCKAQIGTPMFCGHKKYFTLKTIIGSFSATGGTPNEFLMETQIDVGHSESQIDALIKKAYPDSNKNLNTSTSVK